MSRDKRTSDAADHPLRIETASLDRCGQRRRVLFDEAVARDSYGAPHVTRAGLLRSPLEWAAAAVQFLTSNPRRRHDGESPEIEVR